MKVQILRIKALALTSLLTLAGASGALAQSGTWTNDFDSVWSNATNWLNGVVADGSGNTATFSNELASILIVNLDSSRTLGNLSFVQGTYTITNNGSAANILTLAGPAKPIINVPASTAETIGGVVLSGTNGFVLDGGGTLSLYKENSDSNNVLSGGIVFSNGTIQVQGLINGDLLANTIALGSVSSFTFYNGTLNLRPSASTSPSYGNVNGDLIVPQGGIGTLILPVRWSGSGGDNDGARLGLGGTLTGSGTFNVETKYVRNNVVGDWSGFAGVLNITANATGGGDEFRYGANPNGFPNATVNLTGSVAFTFRYYRSIPSNTIFPIGLLTGDNANVFMAGSASSAFTLFFDVESLQSNATDAATFAGAIVNGAGPAGLIKSGAGVLNLTGNNTYSGGTVISNGYIQVGDGFSDSGAIGTGPITNYTSLVLARGGALFVPGAISGPGSLTNNALINGVTTLSGASTYTGPTFVTAGKLIVGTASKSPTAYTISDSAGFGVEVGSSGGTLAISSVSFGTGDTFDFNLRSFGNPTATVVTNTGNIALNGDVTVNVSGNYLTLSTGSITLLEYGSRSGSGNFVPGTLPPNVTATLNDDKANKRLVLNISSIFNATLVWVGDSAAVWDVGNAANQVWKIAGSGVLTNYYDGADVRFDDTATGGTTIDISGIVNPASVIVNNSAKQYTFGGLAGDISGAGTVTKQGAGTLTVTTVNDYSGGTLIDGGAVEISGAADGINSGVIGSGPVTNNGTILLNSSNAVTLANAVSGTGNVVSVNTNATVTISGNSSYSGGLALQPGTVTVLNSGNAGGIGGGITVNSADVTFGSADESANVGTITVVSNAIFRSTASNRNINSALAGTNVLLVADKTGLMTFNGDINGVSGTIISTNAGFLRFNSGGGNINTGSTNALFIISAGSGLQNRNPGVLSLGALEGEGTLGAPQNASGTVIWSIGALNTSTVFAGIVNDNNTNSNNRLTGIDKTGAGTLTLSNATLPFFGPTTVSNGTLALVGSSGLSNSTSVSVVSPGILSVSGRDTGALYLGQPNDLQPGRVQTLLGDGTIQGNVVLGANARLEPGSAADTIGALTVSGNATLAGTSVMDLTTTGSATNDNLTAASITYGGTLILTNLGNITGTNTFHLFNGALSGAFANVITQSLSGVTWDLSQLNANGTVTLAGPAGGAATNPTNITFSVSGGNQLTLAWPADHIGWRLQAQTNALTVGISTNWVDVAGSTATNQMTFTINPTNDTVFYRLVSP